jgi:hypothetical protein
MKSTFAKAPPKSKFSSKKQIPSITLELHDNKPEEMKE